MFKYRKVMLFINRAVYLMSAAMLVAGLVLTILPKPAYATPAFDWCSNIDGNQALNTPGLASDSGDAENGTCSCTMSGYTLDSKVGCYDPSWIVDGKVLWCHVEPNGNSQTLNIPLTAFSGHVDAGGNILHAGDHAGACTNPEPPVDVCNVPGYTTIQVDAVELDAYLANPVNDGDFVIDSTHPCTPPVVMVNVCHVPDYTTESITQAAWDTLHAIDPDDFLVDDTHPCTAPVMVNVCHVPGYTTEEMTEEAWNTLHSSDVDDFLVDGTHPCTAPEGIVSVCHVPAYQLEDMTESAWATLHASDADDFLYDGSVPCEPVVAYCHYDAGENLWTQEQGYESDVIDPDYLLDQGETCPEKVPYCIYDAASDSYTEGAQYLEFIAEPDIEMPDSGSCPVKVAYCHYTADGPYGETWTQLSNFPRLIVQPDFKLEDGEVCPQPLSILDPYCYSVPGDLMQWVIDNPNATEITMTSWKIDDEVQAAVLVAPTGTSLFTTTALGTHTVDLFWGLTGHTSLEWTIDSCALPIKYVNVCHVPGYTTDVMSEENWADWQKTHTSDFLISSSQPCEVPPLPIPETGGAGGPIIPVTGADLNQPLNAWFFGGFGMFGFGMILTGLRKMLDL